MSARCLVLELVPREPAVFSRTAATGGGHATHLAPTGATLMGWAARKLWRTLGDVRATEIFLSGRVRFSDAVAVAGEDPLFPQPSILLAPKHGEGEACLGRAAFEARYNADRSGPKIQPDRPSLGLFTIDGRHRRGPALGQRLRTATEGGRARRGALFGYQHVEPSGLVLRATVEAEAGAVSDSDWEALKEVLAGRMFLGRGAANGYGGGYDCTVSAAVSPWPDAFRGRAARLRIWFLTDAALADGWGNPHLRPGPSDFGLGEEWDVDGGESAVTARRVWPWNRALGCRDMEMPVVEAGSVVTLVRPDGPADVALPAIVGLHRERGWGRIAVMPEAFAVKPLEAARAAPTATGAESALVRWARQKAAQASQTAGRDVEAGRLIREVRSLVQQLGADGPGPAQWSRVEAAARGQIPAHEALQQDEWNKLVETEGRFDKIGEWVKASLLAAPLPLPAKLRVIQAARNAAQQERR